MLGLFNPEKLPAWAEALWWLAPLSGLTFVASLVLIPILAVRIPAEYFQKSERRPQKWPNTYLVFRPFLVLGKNLLGLLLFMAGIIMLVLPGQGLLTMFFGILLLDFPGKYRLERFFVSRPPVLRAINWIRGKRGVAALKLDDEA